MLVSSVHFWPLSGLLLLYVSLMPPAPYLQTPLSLSQRYHSVIMKHQTLILRHTLCKMALHRKKPWNIYNNKNFLYFYYRHDSTTPSTVGSDSSSCYIVFESTLLLLFTICRFCSSKLVYVKKVVTGSFLRVTQKCLRCHKKWVWDSQPSEIHLQEMYVYQLLSSMQVHCQPKLLGFSGSWTVTPSP